MNENCAFRGYCAASDGNFLPTFRDNPSVPSSGFKNTKMKLVASVWNLYREECVGGEKSQQCRISHMGYCKWLDGGECCSKCS